MGRITGAVETLGRVAEKLEEIASSSELFVNVHPGLDGEFAIYHNDFELVGDALTRTLKVKRITYRPGSRPGEKIHEIARTLGYSLVWPKTLKFPDGGDLLSEIHFEDGINHYVIDTRYGRFILSGLLLKVDYAPTFFNGEDNYQHDGEGYGGGLGGGSMVSGRLVARKILIGAFRRLTGLAGRLGSFWKSSGVVSGDDIRHGAVRRVLTRGV